MRELEELSSDKLAGQLLIVGYRGLTPPEAIHTGLSTFALGGVILFGRNLVDLEASWRVCRQLSEWAPEAWPPFIGVDQEGGRVARLQDRVLALPPMRELGRIDDPALSRALAAQQAQELSLLGFNLNFAPVADVDSNPENPIIGDRSFGADPRLVTRHCRAFIEGFQANGVAACIKHFPGHGDTHLDSHVALPTVDRSVVELRGTELYTFERLAKDSATLMTAHVVFSAFDDVPATLSPRLCTTLLRGEFAFEGVVFSDDLEMGALSQGWAIEETSVRAIEAGCDALLICSQEDQIVRARTALAARIEADPAFRRRCLQAAEVSLQTRRRFRPRPAQRFKEVLSVVTSKEGLRLRQLLRERASSKPPKRGRTPNPKKA